jgi:hypothetical protein
LEPETTNIRVIDPTTHPCPPPPHACPPPCALAPPPMPPLQRTTAAHPPLQRTHYRHRHRQQPPLYRTCCLVSPTPSPPLHTPQHHLAYFSPIKPPHQLPQLPSQAKHTPDKIPYAKSQAAPFFTPSPLRS